MFANFNPFDSDDYPENFQEYDPEIPSDNITEEGCDNHLQESNHHLPLPIISTTSSETDEEPNVACDPNEDTIHMSDLKNIRTVLSLLTRYPGGILSNHLKDKQGLIILPLSAVSMLRKPSGKHICNPPAIIYYPTMGPENYSHMQQFNEAIRLIYSVPQ